MGPPTKSSNKKAVNPSQAKAPKTLRSSSRSASVKKTTAATKKNVKSKEVVEDTDGEERPDDPALPSTPPSHGRSLRKRSAPAPETPSSALKSLSLESPTKKARRGSVPALKPTLGSPFVEIKKSPVKANTLRTSCSPKKVPAKAARQEVIEDDFVVPDEDEGDECSDGDDYQPEDDGNEDCAQEDSEPEAVATDGEDLEDDVEDFVGENVDDEGATSDVETQEASDEEDGEEEIEHQGDEEGGEASADGSDEEEGSDTEIYEPGAFFPRVLSSRDPVLDIDSLQDPNAPEGVYPDDLSLLRPGSIESRTDNEATNILPSAIQRSLPQVKDAVIWRHLVWSGNKNAVNLARVAVGSVGSRPYERENTELIVRGRGTAICVVFGLVQESNLYSPRLWNGNTPGERQEFVSFNLLVNPFTFERQRIMAHTVMAMNNWSMKSTEHKGGLNLTTLSAKIGTPATKKKEPNTFFDLTANMVNTASAGYGSISPRRYTEKVPVYDATGIEDFDIDNHIDDLSGTLPQWPEGKEIPILSLVIAGYTVRHSLGTNSNKWLMNTYIQWVIVIADKDQAAGFPAPKASKAKASAKATSTKTPKSAAATQKPSRSSRSAKKT
ncbi:hypothetical protein CC1G_11346 [Coprinopsis cinerea okayama7|uniref:Uncharacterized protein n=1 Tax=Coprinopsis cinerea (strain Okayama-7 / 130 / ATCC MYA-4618 / FGSC 9003) TaxID=240176 RepID=A8P8U3_COPC7|nr:hypothetical protein CC1G_11346 [Coprinopsis cinerea okayama7\|eukprot:XP_001839635.2 hypothetical protein CC1G_11346 [Coprinopsis cinerea okayama7\